MRSTSICWSCAVAIAVGYIGGSYASTPDNNCGSGESKGGLGPAEGAQKVVEGQRIVASVPTSTKPSVISYPKITEGPSLVKRKLGSNHWDLIHDGIQGQKRDATACPTSYILCPQSLNGGCCPSDRVCGSSSCYPSSATVTACGLPGYFACGSEAGGGCCPTSYICATDSCSPSPGVSYSQTCSAGSRLCPSSVGYGCCPTNLGCAVNSCYETTPTTFTLTETLTTTIDSFPTTITTTITSVTVLGEPTGSSTTGENVAKLTPAPTPIAKTPATGSSNGGLSTPELGGIIGGAIFVLIVVLIATFLIIKRLNKVEEVARASRTSSSGPRSGRSGQRPSINPDIDAMSQDPFLMSPSEVSGSIRRGSKQSSGLHSATHEVEANEASSPPLFNSPFSPRSPPNAHYPGGYAPVASSESQYSQSSGGYRNPSVDSTPPLQHNPNAGYFDLPLQSDHRVSVSTIAGRRPSQHGRNWSNASDQSAVSQNSQNSIQTPIAELDAGRDGDRPWSIQRAIQGFGLGRITSRRRSGSDPVVLTGGPTRQQERPVNQGLGHIPEAGESHLHLDAGVGQPPQMTEISLVDRPGIFSAQAGPGYDQKTNDYRNDVIPGR